MWRVGQHAVFVHYLMQHLQGSTAKYLSSIFHVVLLARKRADGAGGGGAALLRAAEHDGVLVEVSCSLHRHRHRAGFLTHIVAVKASRKMFSTEVCFFLNVHTFV